MATRFGEEKETVRSIPAGTERKIHGLGDPNTGKTEMGSRLAKNTSHTEGLINPLGSHRASKKTLEGTGVIKITIKECNKFWPYERGEPDSTGGQGFRVIKETSSLGKAELPSIEN